MINLESGCFIVTKKSATGHTCAVSYPHNKTLEAMYKINTWSHQGWLTNRESADITRLMAGVFHTSANHPEIRHRCF